LMSTRQRTEIGRRILVDKDKTAFFFVTLPLALPIAVIERFIGWVQAFNIPTGGVIVNGVIPKETCEVENPSPYLVNKVREQEGYLKLIDSKFPGMVRAHVPLYDTEVAGVGMIGKVAKALQEEK